MRVFKDYKDYNENKNDGENGVSQEFLHNYYDGEIKKAIDDNISNKDCFDCLRCKMCEWCIRCGHLANCSNCFGNRCPLEIKK
tara:strand:- start:103 stop:351 length:249 start_codon:yes stop_codon:yes gene_type:complete